MPFPQIARVDGEGRRGSDQHQRRGFKNGLEGGQVLGSGGSVDHTVVAAHADHHALPGHDFIPLVDHLFL